MSDTNDMHRDFQAWHGGIYAGRQKEIAFAAWQVASERATAIERERCSRICEDISDANLGHIELDAAVAAIRQGDA